MKKTIEKRILKGLLKFPSYSFRKRKHHSGDIFYFRQIKHKDLIYLIWIYSDDVYITKFKNNIYMFEEHICFDFTKNFNFNEKINL